MVGLSINALCKLSGAAEDTVRDAVQRGLILPVWHGRSLMIDPATGRARAQTWAAAKAAMQPPPTADPSPAVPAADDAPVDEADADDDDDDGPDDDAERPTPCCARLKPAP
jgi:hypothetical protein